MRQHDQGNIFEITIGLQTNYFVVSLPPEIANFGTPLGNGMTGFLASQEVAEEVIEEWGKLEH